MLKRLFLSGVLAHALLNLPALAQDATPSLETVHRPAAQEQDKVEPFGGPTFQGRLGTGNDEGFGFGDALPDPTAFDGGLRNTSVNWGARYLDNNGFVGHYGHYFGDDSRLLFSVGAGSNDYSLDIDYSFKMKDVPGYFSTYFNQTRYLSTSFVEGQFSPGLQEGDHLPWLRKTSTGIGYTTDAAEKLVLSTAITYQAVEITDGGFAGRIVPPKDSQGNPLLVSGSGVDNVLSVRLSGRYADLDNLAFPREGDKLSFFFDQAIPVGAAQIDMTRLGLNYSHFFRIGEDNTLIAQIQGAASFGKVAPYEAYNLGGSYTVRGFQFGEIGGGTSFLQTTLEYRQAVTELHLFGSKIPIRVAGFADYGTALGTADQVIGTPAVVRGKPDSAFGFGLGLHAETDFGLVRLEAAVSPGYSPVLYINLGDRF